ncbi:NAD(P)-binding protein [Linderina pennispora]|uniref:NAD(P)-binding protein n=1 Tax=Linderina pennispora TaxID=61395 RepID=A0A1Y1WHC3_9FUNG|nr:NAD(P)-binding protein [Linderina pennispora]ORX72738.1 NAD(P)-binding protein [Linderina pennispora]
MVDGKINEIHGWAATKPGIQVEPWSYKPRALGPHDVEIKITHSGICGSDLHTIKGEWDNVKYPTIVGHEIVGTVITTGASVSSLKEGDIVGVGAQVYACLKDTCKVCSRDLDPHCPEAVFTYDDTTIDPVYAPPLMCAGATVFAPMLRKGVKKGDRVGIIGIGGLGHLAIQYANALGAEVVAFSQSPSKKQQATELGASIFVDTTNKEELDAVRGTLNYLFVTANGSNSPHNDYVTWMDYEGQIVYLAVPPGKMSFTPSEFIHSQVAITGSLIGGVNIVKETLEFAARHNIRPVIERFPMSEINQALERVDSGRIRYRAVLEN